MTSPNFLVALKLVGRSCLVVGEGAEALSRARALLAAGAKVALVHPSPPAAAAALSAEFGAALTVCARPYAAADLDDTWLAVLTDRDAALAQRLAADCEQHRTFFCAVDQPAQSSFAHLALARAGGLTVGISTAGRAPALARRLREILQQLFDEARLAAYVERLGALRDRTPSAERAAKLGAAVKDLKLEGQLVVPEEPAD